MVHTRDKKGVLILRVLSLKINLKWADQKVPEGLLEVLAVQAKAQASLDKGLGVPPESVAVEGLYQSDLVAVTDWEILGLPFRERLEEVAESLILDLKVGIPAWAVNNLSMNKEEFMEAMTEHLTRVSEELAAWKRPLASLLQDPLTVEELIDLQKKEPVKALQLLQKVLYAMYLEIGVG